MHVGLAACFPFAMRMGLGSKASSAHDPLLTSYYIACRQAKQITEINVDFLTLVDDLMFAHLDQKAPFLKTVLCDAGVLPGTDGTVQVLYVHDQLFVCSHLLGLLAQM